MWTRRQILAAAGLAPLVQQAAEQQFRLSPAHAKAHTAGTAAKYDEDTIAKALAQPVTALNGFDPMRFVTTFDMGRASRLPNGQTLREYRVVAEDRELEVAPGIFFPAWTYNGSVPGPTLRCTEGDRLRIHFVNRSQSEHTMHFHGIHAADMDGVAEIVKPGQEYLYEFDAEPYGLQLYHCHVPPVDLHMNRGLYGAFIIDPPKPRPPAKELVIVSSGWDLDFDGKNEIYVLNGAANFYRDHPIPIAAGELVRMYFVNALEFDPVHSLHIHANFFNALRRTSKGEEEEHTDIVTLGQADRRILEFTYRMPGIFMFHAHQNRFAERGGMAHLEVRSTAVKET